MEIISGLTCPPRTTHVFPNPEIHNVFNKMILIIFACNATPHTIKEYFNPNTFRVKEPYSKLKLYQCSFKKNFIYFINRIKPHGKMILFIFARHTIQKILILIQTSHGDIKWFQPAPPFGLLIPLLGLLLTQTKSSHLSGN